MQKTGTWDLLKFIASVPLLDAIVSIGLNFIPGCQGWCSAVYQGLKTYAVTGSLGAGLRAGFFAAATPGGADFGNAALNFVVDGINGGIFSVLQGGKFGHGFVSSAVGNQMAGAGGNNPYMRVAVSAMVGGTISAIPGGKFFNGAASAAFATAMAQRQSQYLNSSDDPNYFPEGNTEQLDKALEKLNQESESLIFKGKNAKNDAAKWLNKNAGHLQDLYGAEVGALLYEVYGMVESGIKIGKIVTSYHSNGVDVGFSSVRLGDKQYKGGIAGSWHTHPNGSFVPSWGNNRDSGKMQIDQIHYVSSMGGNGVVSMSSYNPNKAWHQTNGITRDSFDNAITCIVGKCK